MGIPLKFCETGVMLMMFREDGAEGVSESAETDADPAWARCASFKKEVPPAPAVQRGVGSDSVDVVKVSADGGDDEDVGTREPV